MDPIFNSDIGEGVVDDELVIPLIQAANISCGAHAGDTKTITNAISLCHQHQVTIGAHPSYPDREHFGRVTPQMSDLDIQNSVRQQIQNFISLCDSVNATCEYIKPHGALYNDMMKDVKLFEQLLNTLNEFQQPFALMILSRPNSTQHNILAEQYDIPLVYEAFADRAYLSSGMLAPRSLPNAVYEDTNMIIQQATQLKSSQPIRSIDGQPIAVTCDMICFHSDHAASIAALKRLRES